MDVRPTALPDVKLLRPVRHGDERGTFSETFNQSRLTDAGIAFTPIQDNQVLSRRSGTVRGLHFQTGALAQAKLVRVLTGAVLDVAVDIRPGSPTFGRHVAVVLDARAGWQLFVPAGFAHGYCTVTDDCEVLYKVDRPWSRAHEAGLRWNDPDLGIQWPVSPERAIMAERDRALPTLADLLTQQVAA